MSDQLRLEQSDAVLRVQIDAGRGNLFTPEMAAELTALLQTPPDGVHVVHLSASGPEFCMGRAPFRSGPGPMSEDVAGLVAVNRALLHSPAVTVAEVQGDAAGFGVGLVVHSDVAVASPEARFSFPEVHSGFAPALVLAWLGPLVGRRKAFWLTATGVQILAREACDLGLVTHVADTPDDLAAAVSSSIELLMSKPPEVHRDIKRLSRFYAALPDGARDEVAADRLVLGALRRAADRSA
jgi:methylglutaconyl-CoA hydratase